MNKAKRRKARKPTRTEEKRLTWRGPYAERDASWSDRSSLVWRWMAYLEDDTSVRARSWLLSFQCNPNSSIEDSFQTILRQSRTFTISFRANFSSQLLCCFFWNELQTSLCWFSHVTLETNKDEGRIRTVVSDFRPPFALDVLEWGRWNHRHANQEHIGLRITQRTKTIVADEKNRRKQRKKRKNKTRKMDDKENTGRNLSTQNQGKRNAETEWKREGARAWESKRKNKRHTLLVLLYPTIPN